METSLRTLSLPALFLLGVSVGVQRSRYPVCIDQSSLDEESDTIDAFKA